MKSVMLIDDDSSILEILTIVFKKAGYEVTVFNDVDKILKTSFNEPSIFIIDKHIGGSDGLDLCHYLKHRIQQSDTPVIIFSANSHIVAQALEAGANDFIEKPFKTKDLLNMVEKHTARELTYL